MAARVAESVVAGPSQEETGRRRGEGNGADPVGCGDGLDAAGSGPAFAPRPARACSDVEELSHGHSRADGADQRAHDDDEDLGDDHVVAGHDR